MKDEPESKIMSFHEKAMILRKLNEKIHKNIVLAENRHQRKTSDTYNSFNYFEALKKALDIQI